MFCKGLLPRPRNDLFNLGNLLDAWLRGGVFCRKKVKNCFLSLKKLGFIPQVSGYISWESPLLIPILSAYFCSSGSVIQLPFSRSCGKLLWQLNRQPPAYVYNQKCWERPQPSLKTLINVIYIYTIQFAKKIENSYFEDSYGILKQSLGVSSINHSHII